MIPLGFQNIPKGGTSITSDSQGKLMNSPFLGVSYISFGLQRLIGAAPGFPNFRSLISRLINSASIQLAHASSPREITTRCLMLLGSWGRDRSVMTWIPLISMPPQYYSITRNNACNLSSKLSAGKWLFEPKQCLIHIQY